MEPMLRVLLFCSISYVKINIELTYFCYLLMKLNIDYSRLVYIIDTGHIIVIKSKNSWLFWTRKKD